MATNPSLEVEISPGFSLTTFTLDLVEPGDGAPGPSAQ
jgi:hypothetical protein